MCYFVCRVESHTSFLSQYFVLRIQRIKCIYSLRIGKYGYAIRYVTKWVIVYEEWFVFRFLLICCDVCFNTPLSGKNDLSGQIPSELGNLENLSTLDLGRCRYEICMHEDNENITNP